MAASTLQFISILEMVYGCLHIFFREYGRMGGDSEGVTGLFYGTMIVLFGQTLLIMTLRSNKKGMMGALMFKAILCIGSLLFAMNLMQKSRKAGFTMIGGLLLYCFLGIPCCALFHQWGRTGGGGRTGGARLG